MDRADFEAALRRDGYEMAPRSMAPDAHNPDHAHGFDARVFVLEGMITIGRADGERSYGPGEWCDVPAGERHSERAGPAGVSYIVGRRSASA